MLAAQTVLQNRYRIIRPIGQGGMGAVYEAFDERLQTTVALKELRLSGPNVQRAFEREARLLAGLRHSALPVVSDHFSEANGQFLVMQYIAGNDLSRMLQEHGAPLPLAQVLSWAHQLLDALDYLHTRQPPIVHRDIKPQNLKLSERGEVVLLDFGLARHQALQPDAPSLSLHAYTLSYAPLEQIQGSPGDPRSDLYALAATLYHLLTATAPPDAVQRAAALATGQPDPLVPADQLNSQVPFLVAHLLSQAMALDPAARPISAAAFRDSLRDAQLAGATGKTQLLLWPAGATTTVVTPVLRRRNFALLGVGLLLVLLLLGGLAWRLANDQQAGQASIQATAAPVAAPLAETTGSRQAPLAMGTTIRLTDVDLTLLDAIRGAAANRAVAQANQFNDPAPEGYEYLLLRYRLRNHSQQTLNPSSLFYIRVTGERNLLYAGGEAVPPELLPDSLAAGATAEAQRTFLVPSNEQQLIFVISDFQDNTDTPRFVALEAGSSLEPDPALAMLDETEIGSSIERAAQIGETVIVRGWQLRLLQVIHGEEATAMVQATNQYNDPPPPDRSYVVVQLHVQALGQAEPDAEQRLFGYEFSVLGADGTTYDKPTVIAPEPALDDFTFYAGGQAEGWVVVQVRSGDPRPLLIFEPAFGLNDEHRRYFELN